ncbi:MAG TPA: 16S rRNA (guanine(527)-N(7))-methyltransferase RsmG [Terriglobales bacterium]|nr:16S rRNA (guanine(527)-N(7))-methyltransferase RsmG [Terriglobales bacterium]
MNSARIVALLEPFLDRPLAPAQLEQTSIYIDILLRWNTRINLTAIRNPEEIVTRHFGESFFLARHVFPEANRGTERDCSRFAVRGSGLVIDIGSGAGFPGLPVKIWSPGIRLTLVESNHKKVAFLREVARALTLTNVDISAERAEALAHRLVIPSSPDCETIAGASPNPPASHREAVLAPADVVTFRAVENFNRTLPLALRFLAPTGRLAILITAAQFKALSTELSLHSPHLRFPAAVPQLQWQTIDVPQSRERVLALGSHSIRA